MRLKNFFFKIFNNGKWRLFNLLSKNKNLVLSKAKKYYENNKDRLSKQSREKYAGLSKEEKDKKKREYRRNKYHTMSEEEKNKRNK